MTRIFDCSEAISVASAEDLLIYVYITLVTTYLKILESVLGNGSGAPQSRFVLLCRRYSFGTITQN